MLNPWLYMPASRSSKGHVWMLVYAATYRVVPRMCVGLPLDLLQHIAHLGRQDVPPAPPEANGMHTIRTH